MRAKIIGVMVMVTVNRAVNRAVRWLSVLAGCGLGGWALGWVLAAQAQSDSAAAVRNPNQVPTVRYARGEDVDLALIIDEWRDRYPDIPVFACTCTALTCGDDSIWPFRSFTQYQLAVALGPNNAAVSESNGFNCFDIEAGDSP
ncbi:MAG: hypothetical protein HC800_01300 [Phormidesmis sp. RL_2_1]|nr:hypothetical protein [Phormidesmis sp. RL_2_1]